MKADTTHHTAHPQQPAETNKLEKHHLRQLSKVQHSHLAMSEMSSRSVLMLLILSRLAKVWMDIYWSPSIWEMR